MNTFPQENPAPLKGKLKKEQVNLHKIPLDFRSFLTKHKLRQIYTGLSPCFLMQKPQNRPAENLHVT